jgi:hypothetical protein
MAARGYNSICMKTLLTGLAVCLISTAAEPTRTLTLNVADGGSVVTQLSGTIAVNKGSSLHRRWVIINDPTCPVQLGTLGIKSLYKRDGYSGSYELVVDRSQGAAIAATDVRAVRLVFTVFDIWGNRDRGLSALTVTDVADGSPVPIEGGWYASENDVEQLFTTVAYVDQVMLPDGKIWIASRSAIAAKLSQVQLKVTESALDPDPQKQPSTGK